MKNENKIGPTYLHFNKKNKKLKKNIDYIPRNEMNQFFIKYL